MKIFTAIVERDPDTKLYVGYIPGLAGAHSQAETLDELQENLREVIEMLLEDVREVYRFYIRPNLIRLPVRSARRGKSDRPKHLTSYRGFLLETCG